MFKVPTVRKALAVAFGLSRLLSDFPSSEPGFYLIERGCCFVVTSTGGFSKGPDRMGSADPES
jgi:hypothetical protein